MQSTFTVPQGKIEEGGHGFFPFLLPFLEQEALANIDRWDKRSQGPDNQQVATMQLKVLQCPSAEPDRWVTAVEEPGNYSTTAAAAHAAITRAYGTSILD